jgi:iron(III) transport system substrate-binding protein
MPTLTRRHLIQASAVTVLTAGASRSAAAQQMSPQLRALYDAAKQEGELTWYSGQLNAEAGEAVGRAFSQAYPGVKANVVRSTSQVAYQRLSQDMRAGVAQADIFSSTDYGHYLFLKREGKLLSFRPANMDGMIPAVRNADPDNMFQIFYVGLYLIGYNTQKVNAADAPKSWKEALDPKWRDQLAIGHPGYSGAIGVLAVALKKQYGWDYFKSLERNKPQIGRSADDPVTLLNAGERSVGLGVSSGMVLLSKARGNPLGMVYPEEGTLAVFSPTAIPKNAPHPNAAKLFMEFCASPAFAEATRPFYIHSLRPEVPPPEGALAMDQIKLMSVPPTEIESGVPEVKELWRDTFSV